MLCWRQDSCVVHIVRDLFECVIQQLTVPGPPCTAAILGLLEPELEAAMSLRKASYVFVFAWH